MIYYWFNVTEWDGRKDGFKHQQRSIIAAGEVIRVEERKTWYKILSVVADADGDYDCIVEAEGVLGPPQTDL